MKTKWLAVGIILLFVGVTIAPTINLNTVKASQQNVIKERINQRELLFQTIVDIANNKEIQRIILKSQMNRGIFPTSEFPVVTKNQPKMMYFLGLILSKIVSKSRIQSWIGKYQFSNQEIQKEISVVIEKNTILNSEITQLQTSDCDCENEITQEKSSTTDFSDTPIICGISIILLFISLIVMAPFSVIIDYFQNTIFEPLVRLFILIIYPIFLPFVVIGDLSLYFVLNNCIDFSFPY